MLAYSKPKQGIKADPRWKVGICLGKTEVQDAWFIGDGNRVFLRRVADASTKYLACYQGFTAYPWEFQQNFGGRIVPSKRVAAMVGGPLLGLPTSDMKGIAATDEDAREVSAFSRSYAGKLEEAKDLVETEEKKKEEVKELSEEQRNAEGSDTKLFFVEEPHHRPQDANAIDEARKQAGPSAPVTTPRSSSQKTILGGAETEGDPKRLKITSVVVRHLFLVASCYY